MSASPVAKYCVSNSQAIPRRVTITSATQLPNEYSTTPGGTIYSTTPGGTRIVYERAFLMQLRNSPMARTPPASINMIPGLTTSPSISPSKLIQDNSSGKESAKSPAASSTPTPPPAQTMGTDEQFQMEL